MLLNLRKQDDIVDPGTVGLDRIVLLSTLVFVGDGSAKKKNRDALQISNPNSSPASAFIIPSPIQIHTMYAQDTPSRVLAEHVARGRVRVGNRLCLCSGSCRPFPPVLMMFGINPCVEEDPSPPQKHWRQSTAQLSLQIPLFQNSSTQALRHTRTLAE